MHQTSALIEVILNMARGTGTGAGRCGVGAGLLGASWGQGKPSGVAWGFRRASRTGWHSHHLLTTTITLLTFLTLSFNWFYASRKVRLWVQNLDGRILQEIDPLPHN
jgi:hypothetical protein